MNERMSPWRWAAPWLLGTLAACGNDDSPPPPAPVAVAQNDNATVAWNAATTLAVTANDTIQNGSASLSIRTPPAHGAAEVVGTSIRYTPAAGYFGDDGFRYALTVGSQTAEADVRVQVRAELTLQGVVRDAPLPGAAVVARVGATALPAVTAGAQGAFSIVLQTADPAAFIGLDATGAGANARVVLRSWLGDASELAAAASAAGVVSAAHVTHVTTAVAALSQRALGRAPASGADLRAAQGGYSAAQVIDAAAAVKLVADAGVPLPGGVADTLALVSSPAAQAAFLAEQAALDGARLAAARQAVLADADIAVRLPAPAAGGASRTLLFVHGEGAGGRPADRLVLNADGTARHESSGVRAGTWQRSGNDIVLRFDQPVVSQGFAPDGPPGGGQYRAEWRWLGVQARQLGGTPGAGPAALLSLNEYRYLEGPNAGSVVASDGAWFSARLAAATVPFSAADFAPGSRWAGVMASDFPLSTATFSMQDTLAITDAGHAQLERLQQSATHRLVEGRLELTVGDAVYTYSRLSTGPLGEERWLAEKRVGAALAWVHDLAVVRSQNGAAFSAAQLARRWLGYANAGVSQDRGYVELLADGSGRTLTVNEAGQTLSSVPGNWRINDAGAMELLRYAPNCPFTTPGCQPISRRVWQPVAASGTRLFVMETVSIGNGLEQVRVNVYSADP